MDAKIGGREWKKRKFDGGRGGRGGRGRGGGNDGGRNYVASLQCTSGDPTLEEVFEMLRKKDSQRALYRILEHLGVVEETENNNNHENDGNYSGDGNAEISEEITRRLESVEWCRDMGKIVDELCVQLKLRGYAWDLLKLHRALYERGLELFLTIKQYNIMIDVCFKASMFDEGMEAYRALRARSDLQPSEITFNLIINSWIKSGNLEEAMKVIEQEMMPVCEPTHATFNPILDHYTKQGDLDKAREILKWMMSMNIQPNIIAFHSLIHGYCQRRMFQEAKDVIREMKEEHQIEPKPDTLQIILNGYMNDGMIDAAEELLCTDMLKTYNIRPTPKVFNPFISRLVKSDQVDRARRLLDKHANYAGSAAYNALLTLLVREGTSEGMQKAEDLIRVMKRKSQCEPDIVTYTLLIEGYGRLEKYDRCQKLVDQLFRNGYIPSDVTYKILRRYGMSGEPSSDYRLHGDEDHSDDEDHYGEGEETGYEMDEQQQQQQQGDQEVEDTHTVSGSIGEHESDTNRFGTPPSNNPHLRKLKKCIRTLDPDQAVLSLRKLLSQSYLPPGRLFNKLCLQLQKAKDVSTLMTLMELLNSSDATKHLTTSDPTLYHSIIESYFDNGKTKEAMNMFRDMQKTAPGLVNKETYVIIFEGFKRQYSLHRRDEGADEVIKVAMAQAMAIFEEMIQNDVKPDVEIFNSLIDGLGRAGEIDQCLSLYEKLKQYSTPNTDTFTFLFQSCEECGYKKKAEDLLQEMRKVYKLGTDPLSMHTFDALVNRITTRDKRTEKQNRRFLKEKEDDMLILSQKYSDVQYDSKGRPILNN